MVTSYSCVDLFRCVTLLPKLANLLLCDFSVDFWICSFSFGVADAISDSDFGLLAATFLY